ncbi:MAG: hypothetical protein ACT4P1_11120 [Sporichthyaceae bacterium]
MNTTRMTLDREAHEYVGTTPLLLAALIRIDSEGWDREAGCAVLDYALRKVVRPVVRTVGFTGAEAEQAESTGWAAAWEALRTPKLRSAESPWGVVNAAVRSAMLNERMAEAYGTSARSAWRIHRFRKTLDPTESKVRGDWSAVADPAALARPLSLSAMLDAGYDHAGEVLAEVESIGRLGPLVDLLAGHGWHPDTARNAILHVAEHARPNPSGTPKAHGWREMSIALGIPSWQARRVTVLLLGTSSWPGLVERLSTGGEGALAGPAVAAAVRATCHESMRPPARAALTLDARQPAMAS